MASALDTKFENTVHQLIEQMSHCCADWKMPWHGINKCPINISSAQSYAGMNKLLLLTEQTAKDYRSNSWGTLRQWNGRGSLVLRGSKAITLYAPIMSNRKTGKQSPRYFKRFWVFNGDQVSSHNPVHPDLFGSQPVEITEVSSILDSHKPTLFYGDERAYYHAGKDIIAMPDCESFICSETSTAKETFYSTLLHELVHWTCHPSRLDRPHLIHPQEMGYAFEELVAEIGAAFPCCELGISNAPRADHAHHLNIWLNVLNNDPALLWQAASKAQEAASYLLEVDTETHPHDYHPPFDLEIQPVQTDLFYQVI